MDPKWEKTFKFSPYLLYSDTVAGKKWSRSPLTLGSAREEITELLASSHATSSDTGTTFSALSSEVT